MKETVTELSLASQNTRNFAIIENKHVVKAGVTHPHWCKMGDANDFEFGTTRWIRKANAKKTIVQQLQSFLGDRNFNPNAPYHNQREVVFVFFDSHNDEKWLHSLDIDLSSEFPNSRTVDIQRVGIASQITFTMSRDKIGASHLFSRLGFVTTHAQNGGNDAVYELRSYIAGLLSGGNIPDYNVSTLDIHGEVVEEAVGAPVVSDDYQM